MSAAGTLRARKQDFVRGAIWDAAIDLFAEKGFQGTTIEDIALAAGVSRRSFFRYFASKDDLMAAGIVAFGAVLAEAIVSAPPECAHFEVVRRAVLFAAVEAAKQPRTRKVVHIALRNPAARQAQLSRLVEVEDCVTGAFLKRGLRRDPLTARVLAHLLLGALDVTFRSWSSRGGQDIAGIAERVLASFAGAICPPPPRADRRRKRSS